MALFLQESIQEEIEISIEEAYEGLIEASMDMQDLTEGLLQADFIIHEECKVLTEAEAENKKVNFLVKALQHIKEFIIKITSKIKDFIVRIAKSVKASWDKLLIKLGVNKEVEVPSGSSSMLQTIMNTLSSGEKLTNDKSANKKDIEESSSKIKQLLSKFSSLVKGKSTNTEKVSTSKLLPVIKYLTAGIVTAGVINSTTLRANEIKGLEKELEVYKRGLTSNITDQDKQNYTKEIDEISQKIKELNDKGKYSVLLTKNIGQFAGMLMVSIVDVVTGKQVVTKDLKHKGAEWEEGRLNRNKEFKATVDERDARWEKETRERNAAWEKKTQERKAARE